MERIIRVSYVKPATNENEIGLEKHRDYYTNTYTLEQAIESARTEMLKLIAKVGGEIISIEQI
jgi:hypothetical protein